MDQWLLESLSDIDSHGLAIKEIDHKISPQHEPQDFLPSTRSMPWHPAVNVRCRENNGE